MVDVLRTVVSKMAKFNFFLYRISFVVKHIHNFDESNEKLSLAQRIENNFLLLFGSQLYYILPFIMFMTQYMYIY